MNFLTDYMRENYEFLKDLEHRHRPQWDYMTYQPEITFDMRAILVDWLVEVAEEFGLTTDTIHLATSCLDR